MSGPLLATFLKLCAYLNDLKLLAARMFLVRSINEARKGVNQLEVKPSQVSYCNCSLPISNVVVQWRTQKSVMARVLVSLIENVKDTINLGSSSPGKFFENYAKK